MTTSATLTVNANPYGWLRGWPFDLTFIVGVAALALLGAGVVIYNPQLFYPILILDLWLLGYHHAVATFTRLAFDMKSFSEHKFLVTWLPVIVAAGTVLAVRAAGEWVLATTYLYWQWLHYTRQSYGIARIYQCKTNPTAQTVDLPTKGLIFLLPACGILFRSYQNPPRFLGMELKFLSVPFLVVQIFFALSIVFLAWWLARQILQFNQGRGEVGYALYVVSHILIFSIGYVGITDINYGWLVLNIWHNAQYVLLVWMYNNNRFKAGIHSQHRFLSMLSQKKNIILYYGVCVAIATLVYLFVDQAMPLIATTTLPLVIVVYQTINFHHYIVDGIIWKIRKKPLRQTLGIAESV